MNFCYRKAKIVQKKFDLTVSNVFSADTSKLAEADHQKWCLLTKLTNSTKLVAIASECFVIKCKKTPLHFHHVK